MINYEEYIGKNIKEVRNSLGYSQEKLSNLCGISNSTLSAYENSKKTPNLITIAKIAKALGVSIERLYYGDENISFTNAVSDEGRKIVNCIYVLWNLDIITYCYYLNPQGTNLMIPTDSNQSGLSLGIKKYALSIRQLINSLNEFRERKDSYSDPEKYLEMLLDSFATEINKEIENEK